MVLTSLTLQPNTETAAAALSAKIANYKGLGFDASTAPSAAYMSTWLHRSPCRAVGVYIGGSDEACAQPNLTHKWLPAEAAAGWHFMPMYVGPALGYSSGVYSSSFAAVMALARQYSTHRYALPNVIVDALWNGAENTADPVLTAKEWAHHHRCISSREMSRSPTAATR
jgi:Domain of unknown function (DUF1906)